MDSIEHVNLITKVQVNDDNPELIITSVIEVVEEALEELVHITGEDIIQVLNINMQPTWGKGITFEIIIKLEINDSNPDLQVTSASEVISDAISSIKEAELVDINIEHTW